MKKSELKTIEEFPDYQISSDGRVWSNERKGRIKGKWLKPRICKFGYLRVTLCKNKKHKTKNIHRLVAHAFIPNPENKPQVNHLSGVKTDNRVENLEFVTNLQNMQHARKIGLFDSVDNRGENHPQAKLTWEQISEMRENHHKMKHGDKPHKKYGIDQSHYYRIVNNEKWYDSKYKKEIAKNANV